MTLVTAPTRQAAGAQKKMTGKRKKVGETFENRNVDVVPLHRQ
jgi:hypothetical protein